MALYKILHYPDPHLRITGEKITEFNSELQTIIDDMFETMYDARGVGLAATQVDIHKQLAVIDVTEDKSQQLVIINPEILEKKGNIEKEEGCLSVPGVYDKVKRAAWVKVRAQDRNGKFFEIESDGLLGHCLQHEIDHLNGKVYLHHLSPVRLDRVHSKLKKHQRKVS